MARSINGIQQVGVGVSNATEAFEWYKKILGTDIIVFKDTAAASLMTQYTGGNVYNREAILALNLQGGGGLEIWQYTNRTPQPPSLPVQLGDTGIFAVKIKCKQVLHTYHRFLQQDVTVLSKPNKNPAGRLHFFFKDPYNNIFEIVEDEYWFTNNTNHLTGGVAGVLVGVSNMQRAIDFYQQLLGYNTVVYDVCGSQADWRQLPGGDLECRRVLLSSTNTLSGAFGKLLGPHTIELVEVLGKKSGKIYGNRFWGDLGFIHVCYDVTDMEAHEQVCYRLSHPLTVNSKNSFEMGEAAGQFGYNEDPDGTLIEYVETHKVPVLKKLGWYLRLNKKNGAKPLPDWMVKCLRFSRVK